MHISRSYKCSSGVFIMNLKQHIHCVKSAYLVQMRENRDQNDSEYEHFLLSDSLHQATVFIISLSKKQTSSCWLQWLSPDACLSEKWTLVKTEPLKSSIDLRFLDSETVTHW